MAYKSGDFVWYDLTARDAVRVKNFYSAVVGWTARPFSVGLSGYEVFHAGEAGVGGVMAVGDMSTPSLWMGHINVEDVDKSAAKVTELGGHVINAPEDIPDIGRFAVCADPHGAVFGLFSTSMEPPPQAPQGSLGHAGWHELFAGDLDEAFAFYSALFGWQKNTSLDMGEMGIYQTFESNGERIGGMMKKTSDLPAPIWVYYFIVDDINEGAQRIKDNGGKVVMGPHQVPDGGWIVQGHDPEGLLFALLATKSFQIAP